jgi:hypothetical protein
METVELFWLFFRIACILFSYFMVANIGYTLGRREMLKDIRYGLRKIGYFAENLDEKFAIDKIKQEMDKIKQIEKASRD